MAYNPVTRGGISGPGGSGAPNNLNLGTGGGAGGGQGTDQFSMQNISPDDYLGRGFLYNSTIICIQRERMLMYT